MLESFIAAKTESSQKGLGSGSRSFAFVQSGRFGVAGYRGQDTVMYVSRLGCVARDVAVGWGLPLRAEGLEVTRCSGSEGQQR